MLVAAWERFLHGMYELTRRLSTIPELRNTNFALDGKWMKFEEYRDYFERLGVAMPTPPFDWARLNELKVYRDAIAHQAGWVTTQNVKKLQKFKNSGGMPYEPGQSIEVDLTFVQKSVTVLKETCDEFVARYLATMDGLGIKG